MFRPTTLIDLADSYTNSRDISSLYAATIKNHASKYATFLGSPDLETCLNYDAANNFLAWMDGQVKRRTLKSYRASIITLWRFAVSVSLANPPDPSRIILRRIDWNPPECYVIDEIKALISTAQAMRGWMHDRTRRSHYWEAAIRVGWETGLRRGDVWRVDSQRLRGPILATVSNKSRQLTVHELTDETVAALRRLDRRPTTLHWPHRGSAFEYWFARLVADSGVCRGTFKWLRRASGSYVEQACPGMGSRHLGHTNAATFRKHYDARLIAQPGTLPTVPRI